MFIVHLITNDTLQVLCFIKVLMMMMPRQLLLNVITSCMMKLKMLMMIRPSLPSCTEIMYYYIETLQMFFVVGKHLTFFTLLLLTVQDN